MILPKSATMRSALISGLVAFAMMVGGPVLAKAPKHRVAAPRNQIAQQEAMLLRDTAETYCDYYAGQEPATIGFRLCVNEQLLALRQLDAMGVNARGARSDCAHFVTGMRALGSMEVVNAVDVLACMKTPNREALFGKCVLEITGAQYDGFIRWKSDDADKIEACFAPVIAPFRPKKAVYFDWENGKELSPISRTAISTTGPVRVTRTSISFSGVSVPLEFLRPIKGDLASLLDEPIEGALYRIVRDPGPLIFKNTLCGDQAKFLVIAKSPASTYGDQASITLHVFNAKANPEALDENGYCASYNYVP